MQKTLSSIPETELEITLDKISFTTNNFNDESKKIEQTFNWFVDKNGDARILYSNEPDGMQDILMNDNGVLAVQSGTQHLMFSKVLPHVPGSAAIKENPSLNEFSGKWKMVSYLETGVFNGKEISFQVDAPIKDALEIREKHLDMSIYGYMYYNLPFVLDSGKLVTLIGDTESESDFIGILIELHTDGYLVAKVMPDENTQLQMVFAKEK